MMLLLALVALLCSVVVVVFLLLWHPKPGTHAVFPASVDPANVRDWCEHVTVVGVDQEARHILCGAPATHELVAMCDSADLAHGDNGATVATYCEAHAPEGAVRVRTLTGA